MVARRAHGSKGISHCAGKHCVDGGHGRAGGAPGAQVRVRAQVRVTSAEHGGTPREVFPYGGQIGAGMAQVQVVVGCLARLQRHGLRQHTFPLQAGMERTQPLG